MSQVQSVAIVNPTNYFRVKVGDKDPLPLMSEKHLKADLLLLGEALFRQRLSGTVKDMKSWLQERLVVACSAMPLNQFPQDYGPVTLSLGKGLFQFTLQRNGQDVVCSKDKLDKDDVVAVCRFLGLPSSGTKVDNLNRIMTYLHSLAPQNFPILPPAPTVRNCEHPKCHESLDATRHRYCTRHHKHEVLAKKKEEYLANNDLLGVYLAELLLDEALRTRKNNLQPMLLQGAPPPLPPQLQTNMDVFNTYEPYINLLLVALGANLDGKDNVAQCDQRMRAKQLAQMFRSARHNKVRLMDGHCGFLFLFISELIKKYESYGWSKHHIEDLINNTCFEVVDIDSQVTAWHAQMYPAFTCITEDIFASPITDKTLLYANFCGVAKSWDNVKNYLKHKMSVKQIMLSFASRNASQFEKKLTSTCQHAHLDCSKLETGRRNFSTYVISQKHGTDN